MQLSDWVGIIGVGIILLAYFLSITRVISSHGNLYFTLNFVGAVIACAASWMIKFWPFVILEAVWGTVSLYALIKNIYVLSSKNG